MGNFLDSPKKITEKEYETLKEFVLINKNITDANCIPDGSIYIIKDTTGDITVNFNSHYLNIICVKDENFKIPLIKYLKNLSCIFSCIKEIPNTLINLECLTISDCLKLEEVPDTLINLKYLKINYCPKIREIPKTLINLKILICLDCLSLEKIPNKNPDINICFHDCPFLIDYNEECSRNRYLLMKIQRKIRQRIRDKIYPILLKSQLLYNDVINIILKYL